MHLYDAAFFDSLQAGALRSARAVVPHVVALLRPRRVVDVGCGLGGWLSVFREHGVEEVLGIDGEHVDRTRLCIPAGRFVGHDLSRPFVLDAALAFDLALSLEVAEHLPPESAEGFVGSLVRLAPVVLFSAAIPHQGGVGHVNEQWPEYWAGLFGRHGYHPVDCLRELVWTNPQVEWWYAQNLLLFGRLDFVLASTALRKGLAHTDPKALARVHPRCYLNALARTAGLSRPAAPPAE